MVLSPLKRDKIGTDDLTVVVQTLLHILLRDPASRIGFGITRRDYKFLHRVPNLRRMRRFMERDNKGLCWQRKAF